MTSVFRLTASCLVAALLSPVLGWAQGTVVLTGKISNRTSDSIAVAVRENPLEAHEQLTYARVNDKGEFRLAVPVSGPTKADLVYGDDATQLFVEPGNTLDIRFKGSDLVGTVKFKGTGAEANTFLAEMDERFVENDGFQVLPDNIMLYEPGFLDFLDYRRKHELKFLEENQESLTPTFRNYIKAEIDYTYANDRLTFQDLREQVVATEPRLKMTPTFYDFLNDEKLVNNPSAIGNETYQEFLLNYIHYQAVIQNHRRTDPDFFQVCYELAKTKLSGPIRPLVMGRVMQESFRFGHVKVSQAMLSDFVAIEGAKKYAPALQADFDAHKAFSIGALAPDFKLVAVNGDSVSLRSFAGKLVYLNFWKSTSGLCLRDLPYAADLAKKFDGKNIVFLNIALDENEPAWKQLVISKKLPGVHARAVGGLRSALAKAYALDNVPAYFLLAEDGTFLNTKPKRLSSHAAVDEIKDSFGKAALYTSTAEIKK
ncbi:TlpA family protein disulfide reductase [Hymenobacter lutimineralis]|uniref:TlpA family protein disulfide reductase n=1 Tax=Hymenobacter lutimineralis TaxID=2606448 RepID=A0A5D6V926_9BACT|nr:MULTISPECIES: TlpA disulfide reductase family protein [Hymenobacter]QIX61590.1 TlpA family protein disulfide reductase [Hymenobacter sp. BT18]TYZ11398.1 TlpA family protein disulfide reductase [Hymenobacter lutimineralis]